MLETQSLRLLKKEATEEEEAHMEAMQRKAIP